MKEEDKDIKNSVVKAGTDIHKAEENRWKSININGLGLCRDCENLIAAESEYGTVMAICDRFSKRLRAHDPIKRCTCYWNRHQWKIQDLVGMGYFIELKRPIGFIQDDYLPISAFDEEEEIT
jgi:hypothetical protein